MKKTIATLALGLSLAMPAWAQNVGDPMPEPKGVPVQVAQFEGGAALVYMDGNEFSGVEAYAECNGTIMERPYAVFIGNTSTLYLDNVVIDGRIDRIVKNPETTPFDDLPICPTNI